MSLETHEPHEVIAGIDDETRHLTVVGDLQLSPGAEATAAFVAWAEQNPFWQNNSDMARRVDYHAEGLEPDWVEKYDSVIRQAGAAAVANIEAA